MASRYSDSLYDPEYWGQLAEEAWARVTEFHDDQAAASLERIARQYEQLAEMALRRRQWQRHLSGERL